MGWPGPVTHRQHVTYLAWLAEQFNVPSRADYYVMANTVAVRQVISQRPRQYTIPKEVLKFGEGTGTGAGGESAREDKPALTVEEAAALSKARWGGFMQAKGSKPPRRGQPGKKG